MEKKKDTYAVNVPVSKEQRDRKEALEQSWPGVIEAGLRALEGIGR